MALIIFTNPAWADCAPAEQEFLACRFDNGKAVELCLTDETARYSFGQPGQTPELALSLPLGEGATFQPWNGVGRSIYEAVLLRNNEVIYEVYAGFDKVLAVEDEPDDDIWPHFGGIYITNTKGNELAHLQCVRSTIRYVY